MEQQHRFSVPGQFETTSWFVLATRGNITDPMPARATGDLFELLEDSDEYLQRTADALTSPFTRDILDGAIAAAMLRSHGGDKLIRLFDEIIADCHVPERWTVIEPVEGCTFESTLFMIEFDLLLALKEIGLPLGLPLALRALSDSDDGLHGVAIDAIKAIGPSATEAVPDLLKYIETNEPAGLSEDHFDYRRSLRRDACGGLAAIGSAKELSKLAKGKLPFDVREAAQKAFDEPGFDF